MRRVYLIVLLTLFLTACASFNPTGTWQLHALDGSLKVVTVQDFGQGNYYLRGSPAMDGVYRVKGSDFICEKPDDPRLTGFAWYIQSDNKLVLTSQPAVWVSEERYLGSLLTRP